MWWRQREQQQPKKKIAVESMRIDEVRAHERRYSYNIFPILAYMSMYVSVSTDDALQRFGKQ